MPTESGPQGSTTLRDIIAGLTAGEAEPSPDSETWEQLISRMHVPGRVHRISEEVFDQFLEVLPPRWMRGNHFVFAEGQDPLQLFWSRQGTTGESLAYFTRRLTDAEIEQFCRLARIPRDYGAYYGNEF
ncbi:MAG TPA: hypothetical protein VMV69_10355 [Pirellulales bacterium]|nr:hypothetical protein [Pirellulales bacterium]